MQWAKTLENYPWIMYLVGGFLIGLFIGYQVLPKILPRKNASLTAAELQSILAVQQQVAALITVRFIIQAIHKSILGEEAPGC